MLKDIYTLADLENWNVAAADVEPPIRLAVLGDPIAHSQSPAMQNAALAKCGVPARYTRLHVKPEELAAALRLLPKAGFLGVNLTIPNKQAAISFLDEVDGRAQKIGAVNTVVISGGKLTGFNTDGPGLVRAIRSEFLVDVRDLRVMVLGAGGGAGRAIAVQCAMEGCERLVLANRTVEKAQALAKELQPYFQGPHLIGPVARLEAVPMENRVLKFQLQNTDLVINASSVGMKHTDPSPLPGSILLPHLMVYDTIYTAARTPLLRAADEAGARGVNGFSMLLHQGALAFEIWFNRTAPIETMRGALESAFNARG
jgi:shikimate dehydrogenase